MRQRRLLFAAYICASTLCLPSVGQTLPATTLKIDVQNIVIYVSDLSLSIQLRLCNLPRLPKTVFVVRWIRVQKQRRSVRKVRADKAMDSKMKHAEPSERLLFQGAFRCSVR